MDKINRHAKIAPKPHQEPISKGATKRIRDHSYYSQIGRLGGKKSRGNFKFDPKRAQELGRKGGLVSSKKRQAQILE